MLGLDQMGRIKINCSPDKVGGGSKRRLPFYTIGLESSAAEVGFGWLNGLIMINQLHR